MRRVRKLVGVTILAALLAVVVAPMVASAQDAQAAEAAVTAAATGGDNAFTMKGWIALAAGLAIGIAALGGALGQGRAASAALEGIARNPGAQDKIFTPMILGLALIESLVIYALVIAFVLWAKL